MADASPLQYATEPGPMGAIGESEALMLRVNRNCPWNRCLFCPVYKNDKFSTRPVGELERDIDAVSRTRDLLADAADKVGADELVSPEVLREVVAANPSIYGTAGEAPAPGQRLALGCLSGTARFLFHGARRVFLQDADALAMKVPRLVETLKYLKRSFPTIDTITCYARSRSCARRPAEDLSALAESGLSWCFVGVESGCDEVLDFVKKGVTAQEHIDAGRKLRRAGIEVAAFVMPGLAGHDPALSGRHVAETVRVLNRMRPSEIRVRSLAVLVYAPLYEHWKRGEFAAPTEDALVEEISGLLSGIDYECVIETLQMTNPVVAVKGPIGEKREPALKRLSAYRALAPNERALFNLKRYLGGGYLRYLEAWGGIDDELERLIDEAWKAVESDAPDALEMVDKALFAMKSRGVP
jgi:hypothetical protein